MLLLLQLNLGFGWTASAEAAVTTPESRQLLVAADDRALAVLADDRDLAVAADDRAVSVN